MKKPYKLLFKHFFIKIKHNMNEQEKKRQRIYDLFNAENKQKNPEIIAVSWWTPLNPDLNSVDYAIWVT